MNLLDDLNKEAFARDFLESYLADGFTSLSKREIDLLVLRLLLCHVNGWTENQPAFALAQVLKAKRGRVRSMLDELSFRNADNNDSTRERICLILDKSEKDFDKNKVKFQIEDGYLREYTKNIIQSDFGITDTSFDRSIISLSGDKFLTLVTKVMGQEARKVFEEELEKAIGTPGEEGLFKTFFRAAAKSSGEEFGKRAIRLGSAVVTGGVSEIPDLIKAILKTGS